MPIDSVLCSYSVVGSITVALESGPEFKLPHEPLSKEQSGKTTIYQFLDRKEALACIRAAKEKGTICALIWQEE